jgi:hypothetical protein
VVEVSGQADGLAQPDALLLSFGGHSAAERHALGRIEANAHKLWLWQVEGRHPRSLLLW